MWQCALLCVNQLHLSMGHLFRGHIFWCIPLWIFDLPMSDQGPKKKNFRNFDSLSFSASWTKFAFLSWENQGHDHLLSSVGSPKNPTPGHLPQWLKTKSKTSFRPCPVRDEVRCLFGRKFEVSGHAIWICSGRFQCSAALSLSFFVANGPVPEVHHPKYDSNI